MDKCIGCVWATPTMHDEHGDVLQIYCLPHLDGCPKGNADELEKPIDRIEE